MKLKFSLGIKMALVNLAYTVPIMALLTLAIVEKNKVVQFAESEAKGNAYLRPVIGLLYEMSRYDVISNIAAKDVQLPDGFNLNDSDAKITKYFEELRGVQEVYGHALQVTEQGLSKRKRDEAHPDNLLKSWLQLKVIKDNAQRAIVVPKLLGNLKDLITHVGDTSNLVLDPDLNSFYLMDSTDIAIPSAIDHLYALTFMHFSLSKKPKISQDEYADQKAMASLFKSDMQHIADSTTSSINEDMNLPTKNEFLQTVVKDKLASLVTSADLVRKELSGATSKSPAETIKMIDRLMSQIEATVNDQQSAMDQLFLARIAQVEHDKKLALVVVVGLWAVTWALALLVQSSVTTGTARILAKLRSITASIQSSSVTLSASAQKSSLASSQEAAAVREFVAATAEMTSMLAQSTSHTESANVLSRQTLEHTRDGADTMRALASSMEATSTANARLKDIVKIIEGIAGKTVIINDIVFKTQLLAVNASIEAARAGHHGKGFAVVANEVASLATLSGKAASEIRMLLDESRTQVTAIVKNTSESVESGRKISGLAIQAFDGISSAVNEINDRVQQIYDGTKEQEVGVRQTSQAIGELNTASRANTDLAAENSLLSDQIRDKGKQLENVERAMSFVLFGIEDRAKAKPKKQRIKGVDALLAPALTETSPPAGNAESTPSFEDPPKQPPVIARVADISASPGKSLSKNALAARISRKAGLRSVQPIESAVEQGRAQGGQDSSKSGGATRFSWQPGYDVGVEDMNDEHKGLLKLMARLEQEWTRGGAVKEQFAILEELSAYTIKHFRHEEDFFDSIGFPQADSHKLIHKNLIERLDEYAKTFKADGAISEDLFGFLRTWLSAHIMGVDIKYGEFAKGKQSKVS